MSGPSLASSSFDLAAAPLSCSRSNEPTAGMSRSMMNFRKVMASLRPLGSGMLQNPRGEEQSPHRDDDEIAQREEGQPVHDVVVGDVHQAVQHPQSHIDPGQEQEG